MNKIEKAKVDLAILLHHTQEPNGRHRFEGQDADTWMQQANALTNIAKLRSSEAALAYALECAYISGKLVRMDVDAETTTNPFYDL